VVAYPKLATRPCLRTCKVRLNTARTYTSTHRKFGECACACRAPQETPRQWRQLKQRRRVMDDGICCCTYCHFSQSVCYGPWRWFVSSNSERRIIRDQYPCSTL